MPPTKTILCDCRVTIEIALDGEVVGARVQDDDGCDKVPASLLAALERCAEEWCDPHSGRWLDAMRASERATAEEVEDEKRRGQ